MSQSFLINRGSFAALALFGIWYTVKLGSRGDVDSFIWILAALAAGIGVAGVLGGKVFVQLLPPAPRSAWDRWSTSYNGFVTAAMIGVVAVPFIEAFLAAEWKMLFFALCSGGLAGYFVAPPKGQWKIGSPRGR